MQTNKKSVDIHIIDVNNVRLIYESSIKEYNAAINIVKNAAINIAKMADDNSAELEVNEARREGVITGIKTMANAYLEIRKVVVSNYTNMPSSTEAVLREEYDRQGKDKGLSIALKVAPLIGVSKATYKVSIDTLFKHYANLNTAVSEVVDILKEQKDALQ